MLYPQGIQELMRIHGQEPVKFEDIKVKINNFVKMLLH